MINNKRISKLRKRVLNSKFNISKSKYIVKSKEGLFLFDLLAPVNSEDRRKKIDSLIPGIEFNNLSDESIEDILLIGDGSNSPILIYGGFNDEVEQLCKEFSINGTVNYKDLSLKQLILLAGVEEE